MPARARIRPILRLLLTAFLSALGAGLVAILPSSAFYVGGHRAAKPADVKVHTRTVERARPRSSSHPRLRLQRGPVGPTGPQGPAGPVGPAGPTGPAAAQVAHSLQIDWRGLENASGHDNSSTNLPGIGTLTVTCDAEEQTLNVEPENASGPVRTVLDVTVFQGEGTEGVSSNKRDYSESNTPISLELPPNGMISATISVEPVSGRGGGELAAPTMLTLSSEYKMNGASGDEDDCFVAAQVVQQQ